MYRGMSAQYQCNAFLSTKRFLTSVAAELFETCASSTWHCLNVTLSLPALSSCRMQFPIKPAAVCGLGGHSLVLLQDMENIEVY